MSTDPAAGLDNSDEPLVRVENLTKHFPVQTGLFEGLHFEPGAGRFPITFERDYVRAVDDVSFTVRRGETLGLVGESGCGKSTLARTILQLVTPTSGTVVFDGEDLRDLGREELRRRRRDMQLVFQDPQASLDPRMTVGEIVAEPMDAHGLYEGQRDARVRELLDTVGLDPSQHARLPHQFSGGQRQRINLARALSVNPEFVVCDEPTSALDASVQAKVLNTMATLQAEFGLTYLFISHDLSVVRHVCDRVAVMYLGEIVELADTETLFADPKHPYTRELLSSIQVPDPRVERAEPNLHGDVPSPIDPPAGCRFHTRCPKLIPPERFDLDDIEWDAILTFVRAVERRSFRVDAADNLREQFFPDGVPEGEAGRIVERSIGDVEAGEWGDATRRLDESFVTTSVCSTDAPADHVVGTSGDTEIVACHRYADEN